MLEVIIAVIFFVAGLGIGRWRESRWHKDCIRGSIFAVKESDLDGGETHLFLELDAGQTPDRIAKSAYVIFRVKSR